MKSPLVDALRLASGQDKPANHEDAQAEPTLPALDDGETAAPQPTLLDYAGADQELSLLEATGALVVRPADEDDDEFAASQVIPADAVNEAIAEPPAMRPAPLADMTAPRRDGRQGLARIGLFSPLICLLLGSAATGSYFLYQSAGGNLQDRGLGILAPERGVTNSPTATPEPDALINRFPLIGDSRRSSPRARLAPASRSGTASVAAAPARASVATATRGGIEDNAFAALNEAYAAYESGDLTTAEAAYRQALEISPRHPNALQGLAAILHRSGRVAEATRYYETLLSVDPDNIDAAAALLAGQGESLATESEIKVLLQRHPQSAHLHNALGTFQAQRGRWAEARRAYYAALAIDPGNPEYEFNLAVSLENLGQFDDARARYEAVLANATEASAIDSELVAARISMLTRRSGEQGTVQ